jgi:hypothetical protein
MKINLDKSDPVRTDVKISNGLSDEVDFDVAISNSVILTDLDSNGVYVSVESSDEQYTLNDPQALLPAKNDAAAQKVIKIPAKSEKVYTFIVTPTKEVDYELIIPIKFTQVAKKTSLTTSEQTIELRVKSTMAVQKQNREKQLLIAGGIGIISLVAVAIIAGLYFWQKPKQDGDDQAEQA